MVFIWHSGISHDYLSRFQFGYAGVSFFFVLSGFILTFTYAEKLQKLTYEAAARFYIARIAKIYPVHILTFLASIPLVVLLIQQGDISYQSHKLLGVQIFSNVFLLQSFVPSYYVNFSFNGVAWSISNEFFFYACFPFLIYAIARLRRQINLRMMAIGIVALWLLLVALLQHIPAQIDSWQFYIFPPLRLFDFVFGIFLCLAYQSTSFARFSRHISEVGASIIEVGVIIAVELAIYSSQYAPQILRFGLYLMPFWALLIFVFANQKGIISRALSLRPFLFLGEISFSFYMVHQLVIRYTHQLPFTPHNALLIESTVTLGLSGLLYLFFEEPSRRFLRVKLTTLFATLRPKRMHFRLLDLEFSGRKH